MAVTTAFGHVAQILRENLGDSVINLNLDDLDDPADRIIRTMKPLGLGGRPESGNIYEARRKIRLSRGAMVQGGSFDGNTIESLGANSDLPVRQRATAKAPNPEDVPLSQRVTLKTTLKRILGNVTINQTQINNEAIGMDLDEMGMGYVEDATYQVRKQILNFFWSDGSGAIAQVAASASITDASETAVTLQYAPYNRFIKGQKYWFYSTTSWPTTTTRKGGTAVCTGINDDTGQPKFQMLSGHATASLVANDLIVPFGFLTNGTSGTSLAPKGIEYMCKETGEFFGLSDITQYPEFIGYVEGDETNPVEPEPDRIAKLVNKIKKAGYMPPTMLISESALSAQYAYTEKAGYAVYPINQYLGNPNGGVGKPIFQHGSIIMPWEDSEMCRPGTLHGIAPETIEKFQPAGADTIRWWNGNGPGAGVEAIFVPVNDGTEQTELWQAPFETHVDFLCTRPKRNFRYVGLVTQNTA